MEVPQTSPKGRVPLCVPVPGTQPGGFPGGFSGGSGVGFCGPRGPFLFRQTCHEKVLAHRKCGLQGQKVMYTSSNVPSVPFGRLGEQPLYLSSNLWHSPIPAVLLYKQQPLLQSIDVSQACPKRVVPLPGAKTSAVMVCCSLPNTAVGA